MKVIVIGDMHGLSIWKKIVEAHPDADKYVFTGDYFDSKKDFVPSKDQLLNFDEVLRFKRLNIDKVILLIGNHDFHYFKFANEQYGGFQAEYKRQIGEKLDRALLRDYLKVCFRYNNYLFTHAGVSEAWCKHYEIDIKNVEQSINELFIKSPSAFFNNKEIPRCPLWIRPEELKENILTPYTHIVGHTQQLTIKLEPNLILVDALTTNQEYLIIEDEKVRVSIVYN